VRRAPLALGLIATRITADTQLPLTDIATELHALGLDALDSDDPTASLPTVLSWSLRHLTAQQREGFALLGIAPGPDTGLPAVVRPDAYRFGPFDGNPGRDVATPDQHVVHAHPCGAEELRTASARLYDGHRDGLAVKGAKPGDVQMEVSADAAPQSAGGDRRLCSR
jgi:hypothetical protein